MRANSFKYLTKQGFSSLWKNRLMTVASVGVLTACLLIVGFAVLITENINQMVGYVESQNEMVVFVSQPAELGFTIVADGEDTSSDTSSDEQVSEDGTAENTDGEEVQETIKKTKTEWQAHIDDIENQIKAISGISSIDYVSSEEGLESMGEMMGDKAYLLDRLYGEENPISESFVVKIADLEQMETISQQVYKIAGISLVKVADEFATTLIDVRKIINFIGFSIIAALSIVSLVIIINTIRASIFTRSKEISIMKYVGATKMFIRLPFIVEGVCLGTISALLAFLLIWCGYSYILNSFIGEASTWLQSAFTTVIPFEDISAKLAVFFGIASIGIGTIGSMVSIRNHIKM